MKKDGIKSVWEMDLFRLAHELVLKVYKITAKFPRAELFSLVSQMRRAATSIPMNVAEGAARGSRAEYRRFAAIAKGSVGEVLYQLLLSRDLGYIHTDRYSSLVVEYNRVDSKPRQVKLKRERCESKNEHESR